MDLVNILYIIILFTLNYFTIFHLILWFEVRNKLKRSHAENKNLPYVSIIVPAYNEEKVIGKSLQKLLSISYPKNKFEVLVVDDGSTDNTYNIAKGFESQKVRVFKKVNTGKAASLNFGIKHSKYEFVAVMDADSFLERDALRKCMTYFDEDGVVAVTSCILVKRKKTVWEKLQSTESMLIALIRKAQEQLNLIGVTPGPLSVYRKNILVKVGGFDKDNLIEDAEIAWRLLKHGYKVKMAFDAVVHSLYPSTFGMWWKQRRRWVIGGLQTFLKYFGTIFDRRSHGVGNFLVPVNLIGYSFSLIGTSIFGYLAFTRIFNYILYLITAYSSGVNPFSHLEFVYNIDFLFIYGSMLFLIALFTIRLSIKVHNDRPNIFILALFLTMYPTLLTINLLTSLYKFVKNERGWLTK